jgi:hypothetical protein
VKITPSSSYKGVSWILSRSEEITSEVRKLVLTCRSLEAQLQQSIPKKTHQEVIGKMQGAIDSLSADLGRTKNELAKTISLGERINALESTLEAQSNMISSQNNVIGALTSKFSEALVLATTYAEATEKIQRLEERIATMVDRSQYDSLVDSYHEVEERLSNSVPKDQLYALEDRLANTVSRFEYEELEGKLSQMVPREELALAEAKVQDLEHALLNSVPRQDFEELASKVGRLSSEADAARATAQEALQVASTKDVVAESPQESVAAPIVEDSPSVVPWGVTSYPTPAEPQTAATEVPIEAPVEVPVSPRIETSPAPEITAFVTPVIESQVVETTAPQQIVVSADGSQSIVSQVETVEAPAPIVESIATEQHTLDGSPIDAVQSSVEVTSEAPPVEAADFPGQTTLTENVPVQPQTSVVAEEPSFTPDVAAVGQPPVESVAAVDQAFPAEESSFTPASEIVEQIVEQPVAVQETAVNESTPEAATVVSELQTPESTFTEPVAAVQSAPTEPSEIREVQSQLADINAAADTGETTFTTAQSPLIVEFERGFKFTATEFCARSGLEFIEDLEKVDLAVIEQHCRNGDFERWFKEVLADESTVEGIRSIRESNLSGTDMKTQLVAIIAPHYRK